MTKPWNLIENSNSRFSQAEEKKSALKDRIFEIIQLEERKEKK